MICQHGVKLLISSAALFIGFNRFIDHFYNLSELEKLTATNQICWYLLLHIILLSIPIKWFSFDIICVDVYVIVSFSYDLYLENRKKSPVKNRNEHKIYINGTLPIQNSVQISLQTNVSFQNSTELSFQSENMNCTYSELGKEF